MNLFQLTQLSSNQFQRPRRPGLFQVLRRSGYWKCLSCSLLLIGCGLYASWCHFKHMAYSGLQPLLIFVQIRVEDALQYLKSLRNSLPIVWWKCICYHYVRKTRQVIRYRNGDAVPTTQIYYERVDSHSAGNVFIYDVCGVKVVRIILVRVNRGFVFACIQAAREFEEQRTRFFNENETRDDYMEVREGMDLSDVCRLEDVLVFRGSPPWFLHPFAFWIFSLLLLSWPLRIYAECRTAMLNYQVTKLFGTSYLSPSSVNYTGPLTRTSTMETVELEAALRREQYFVTLVDPSEPRVFSHPIPMNNEQVVLRNYGALEEDLDELTENRRIHGSRSLNFLQAMRRDPMPRVSLAIPLRTCRAAPPRSLSIAGLSGWSNGYHPIGRSPVNDRTPLLDPPDEPPPSYEMYSFQVALRMCAPLYDRLRRSISSRLNSVSQSSSKELKTQNNHSRGSSRNSNKNDTDHDPNVS
ncbi:unnamed protein product [Angiostrongylus costaricensis]|uniref:Transmembrane protein 151A n=1 Tax=Angiostrongylus costaricensis TaxID=334426 RepID=A0A158PEU4_ANGCS|nr:unnamed protein product [Angiostrongylus costaricensis]